MPQRSGIRFDLRGFEALTAQYRRTVMHAGIRGMRKAVTQLGDWCEQEEPTVPLDSGDLRASRFEAVVPPTGIGVTVGDTGKIVLLGRAPQKGKITGVLAYLMRYAAWHHECPFPLKRKTPGSGPKYVETKMVRHGHDLLGIVAEEIRATVATLGRQRHRRRGTGT